MEELSKWVIFNAFILTMLGVDLCLHRKAKAVKIKEAVYWSIFWIGLALLFNVYIYYSRGSEAALSFLTGYLIEKSLSVDNLFVFLLIFKYFKTPETTLHKVLFWGVLGAIVMRALFILLGLTLLTYFHWMIYILGLFLIFTGIRLALEKDKEVHPENNPVVRLFKKFMSITPDYVEDKFFVVQQGKKQATPLFIVLIAVETTDVIFAVDSIPAILAITQDPYIVYTSNIFAILGLRSLYFVLQHVMGLFHYLNYGLAFILVFIGVKMLLDDIYSIPTGVALGVVFTVIMLSIVFSVLFPIKKNR